MDKLHEFHQDMLQQVYAAADADEDYIESQFLQKSTEFLIDEGVVEDFIYTPYRSTRGLRVDGYDFVEDRGILNLFVCDFRNTEELSSLTNTDISNSFKRIENFFISSLKENFYPKLEETSPGYELAFFIFTHKDRFSVVKMHLISNGELSSRVKSLIPREENGYQLQYDIWDLSRFFQVESSGKGKEDIEIDFQEEFGSGLPCLSAHISAADYQSYLAVIPGNILSELYDKYGSRLLEQNVRSFLQTRANVNKGIRTTIINDPEMFFAYNNGLTATAEEIQLSEDGQNIIKLKNFQIVNGGQTTASLFNVSRKDGVSLAKIFIQMKLSIVDPEKSEEVVPNISRFANTQNKVSEADFFSNHAFHIRMEEKSRRIWAPAKGGEIRQTKWFYERARGQYLDAQSKLTQSKKKEFQQIHPRSQMITKTDLAKYMMVWEQNPQTVSKGAQKNFRAFAELISKYWEQSDEKFNDLFYHEAVAKAILFKTIEKLVSSQPWYSGGYRANIVAYALSALAYLIEKTGKVMDFGAIWQKQEADSLLYGELENITKKIHDYIIDTPSNISNVTEWCKKDFCWQKLKERIDESAYIQLTGELIIQLKNKEDIQTEQKYAKKEQKIDNQMNLVAAVIKIGSAKWQEILDWGTANKILDNSEVGIINAAIRVEATGRVPTAKQCKRLMVIVTKLEDEGMLIHYNI